MLTLEDAKRGNVCRVCEVIRMPSGGAWITLDGSRGPEYAHQKCLNKLKAYGLKSTVDHPNHYGGKDDPFEAIKVIEAWDLGFNLGNTVKYIRRAGHKEDSSRVEYLKKALWYLQREIDK